MNVRPATHADLATITAILEANDEPERSGGGSVTSDGAAGT